jgi:hypothetical protein
MNISKFIATQPKLLLTILFGLALTMTARPGRTQENSQAQADQNSNVVMYLGKVEVRGQQKIFKTLQAIKVALREPFSSDPKLANVMVCRLQDEAGSHVKQVLICGTNRNLSANREHLQTSMMFVAAQNTGSNSDNNMGACMGNCTSGVTDVLQETVNSQPGQYLNASVNGPELRSLLNRIPVPDAQSASTSAPSAVTHRP